MNQWSMYKKYILPHKFHVFLNVSTWLTWFPGILTTNFECMCMYVFPLFPQLTAKIIPFFKD